MSCRSGTLTGATLKPRFPCTITNWSDDSRDSASRNGLAPMS